MASGKISVDTMRLVDYWAGVPLCAVSTLVKAVVGRPSPGTPRKVLLVELSEMGSAILVDPMMRALERRGLELHFAIFAQNKASLDLLKTVPEDNIFKLRADSLATVAVDTLRFLRWTRAKGIDTVIDLEMFSRYSALLSGWSGAGNVVGFHRFHNEGLYRGSMLTHRVPFNPHIHVLRNFFSMLHALDAGPGDYLPAAARTPPQDMELARADIPAAAIAAVADKVAQAAGWDGTGPLVLLNANASDLLPQRRWPRERFAALARKVLEDYPGARVLLTGAPAERDGLQAIVDQVGDRRCVNFAGSVSFAELVALYHLSTVMVTNDSGPAHFAAVTRMPTVTLFGPETPKLYGSLGPGEAVFAGIDCSPCVSAWNHRKTSCTDNKCLQAIGVDEVYERVRGYIS